MRWLNAHVSTPNYPDAISHPVMLVAELFIQLRPWGPDHSWLNHYPGRTPEEKLEPGKFGFEVERLKAAVYGVMARAIASRDVASNSSIADAIGLWIIIIFKTEHFEACRPHIMALVRIARAQIKIYKSVGTFEKYALPDVARTVAIRNVTSTSVSKCEAMLSMAMRMLRCAGAELIGASDEQINAIDMATWVERFRDKLLPIHDIATTLA